MALRLVAGVILLLSNGFFVTTEFALTRVRQFDKSDFEGSRGLELAWEMTDKLELYLSSCQVGITISSVALGVVAEPAVTALFGELFVSLGLATSASAHTGLSIIVALAIINLLHVVIGEQVPTYLGVERSQFVCKYLAPVLYIWMKVMYPVIILSDRIAKLILSVFGVEITRAWTHEEEGPSNISEARREMGALLSGVPISDERKTEILNAVEIGKMPLADIMIDDDDIQALRTDSTIDEIIEFAQQNPHTRYPVYDATHDAYVGLVYSAALLQNIQHLQDGDIELVDLTTELPVFNPSISVSKAIDEFQASQQELALVSSTDSDIPIQRADVDGMLTSTDALEQITGQMEDPLENPSE